MNLLQRGIQSLLGIESRSSQPVGGLSNPPAWLVDLLTNNQTASGVSVTPERALGLPVVFSCARIKSETIASLPVSLYRQLPDGDVTIASDRVENDILAYSPYKWYSSYTFREYLQTALDLRGNGYAQILRNARGELTGLKALHHATRPFLYKGNLWYECFSLDPDDTTRFVLPEFEVLHLVGPGSNTFEGRSPITILRETLGSAISGQNMMGHVYRNKANIGGILSTDQVLTPDQVKTNKDSWQDQYAGAQNAGKTPVLMGGFKFQTITLSPADTQYIENANLTIDQLCGAYRVPPHMVGKLDRATFSNIEHQSLEFYQNCVLPMVKQWEQQLNRKLIPARLRSEYFFSFNVDSVLRADTLSRYRAHAIALNWGILNRDEVRKIEKMNKIPDGLGSKFMSPLNMTELGAPNDQNKENVPSK